MRTSVAQCWERALRFMQYVNQRAPRTGSVNVSKAEIACELHCTIAQATYTIKYLLREGYLTSRSRFGKDGGTLGNSYILTKKGKAVLMVQSQSETQKAPSENSDKTN